MAGAPVLIIAPHALDEVLGCAGVMALAAEAGRAVHVLVLCGDGTGTDGKRREAATKAAVLLGAAEPPRFAGFPENKSDTIAIGDVVSVIEKTVNALRPATVYVSHGNLNIDHQTAFRAAATALRPMPGGPVEEFLSYEIASSTDWAPPGFGAAFTPTRYIDIAAVLERKMSALALYAFDMRPPPHARSMQSIENLARARGASVGLAAAEAFMVLRQIG